MSLTLVLSLGLNAAQARDRPDSPLPENGAVVGPALIPHRVDITINLEAIDMGNYNSTGLHDPNNTNYVIGDDISQGGISLQYRNFFVFDLSSLGAGDQIIDAHLEVYQDNGFVSPSPSETWEAWDVTTAVDTLRAGGSGKTSIYNDLGTGTSYGSQEVTEASEGNLVSLTLNAMARGHIQDKIGNLFAIGGSISSLDSNPSTEEFSFGFTTNNSTNIQQLRLTVSRLVGQSIFQISQSTSGSKVSPVAALDYDGDFIVVWHNQGTDKLEGRRYGANGNAAGNEFEIAARPGSHDVGMDADGDFVVVWRDSFQNLKIYAQRYNASSTPQGNPIEVIADDPFSTPDLSFENVAVAMDGLGNFVVAWKYCIQQTGPDQGGIQVQRYGRSGNPIGSLIDVVTDSNCFTSSTPDLAMDESGNFVVAWETNTVGDRSIYTRRYDKDGTALEQAQLICDGKIIQVGQDLHEIICDAPAIAVAANGSGYIVAYEKDSDIYARRYFGSLSSEFLVVSTLNSNEWTNPTVAMDYDGDFVISWQITPSGASFGQGVYLRRYDNQGAPKAGAQTVETSSGLVVDSPTVAIDSGGNFVIAWRKGSNIVGQRFLPSDAGSSIAPPSPFSLVYLPLIIK